MRTSVSGFCVVVALSAGVVLLPGCPDQGVVCGGGLTRCGTGCADFQSDRRSCGACGVACQEGQDCSEGRCTCRAGSVLCEGTCVVTLADPKHCGGCGKACAPAEACEQGTCKSDCQLGSSRLCGQSCVNILADSHHCGACGNACENAQSCHGGICSYDLVAACFSTGQVTGLQDGTGFKGPLEPMGSGPAALATLHDVLLSADGLDRRLYPSRLTSVGGHAFAQYPGAAQTGAAPNHVVVDDPFVYLVNSTSGTLQILQRGGSPVDAGVLPVDAGTGLQLVTIAELHIGANTIPHAIAQIGTSLFVTLHGGLGVAEAAAGQKVIRVDIADRRAPKVVDTFDLTALDLKPFSGGAPVPRPDGITVHGGFLYVTLNNSNPTTYKTEGPGMLAKIDPVTRSVTAIDLGADACLNPIWVTSWRSSPGGVPRLYVSCMGKAVFTPNWELVSVEKTGVVAVDELGQRKAAWSAACPPDAGSYQPDSGTGCMPVMASRLAVTGGRVYVGDQNGGRVFVLDADRLTEQRGYAPDAGRPIQACPVIGPFTNVSDVIAVP